MVCKLDSVYIDGPKITRIFASVVFVQSDLFIFCFVPFFLINWSKEDSNDVRVF